MNRTRKVTALAGAALVGALLLAYGLRGSGPAPAARIARLLTAPAPTSPLWAARVTPFAGSGVDGVQDGAAPESRFSDPFGLAIDRQGRLHVADGGASNRIRRIGADGLVTTLAGGREGFADGLGGAAAFHTPSALAFDRHDNLYVADTGNHAIRKITPDGSVTTLAGDGIAGQRDGVGRAARFYGPVGIAVDAQGNVFVADTYNDRIRRIAADGTVTTLAGGARPGFADGIGAAAAFDTPSALALGKDGTLFVADTGNHALRRIGADGLVTTLAAPAEGERQPLLRRPTGLAITADGYLYLGGAGGRLLQRAPTGELHALDDADQRPGARFGADGKVRLYAPRGLAVERSGALLVADAQALRVLRLAPPQAGVAPPAWSAPPPPPRTTPMPWPVAPQDGPHEVVGLMGEVRGSYDGESRDHFHAGLDVRADIGSRVLAIAPAKVSDPFANWGFGTLSEGLALGPLAYIHMRVGRDGRDRVLDPRFALLTDARGKPERVRVARGTRFAAGDTLGSINGMAHVHLDYTPGGVNVNPLTLPFPGVQDSIAPRLVSVALYDAAGRRLVAKKGQPLRVARLLGALSIVVDGYDQMDGNLARRRLGLYRLGYQLLHADGSALPGFAQPLITQVYDRLPREREAVKLLYAPDSGITVYGSKATRFAYALNNTLAGGRVEAGAWQVGALAPGDYILRIYAADYAGQVAREGRDLAVRIE